MAWRFALMIDPAASDDPATDFSADLHGVDPPAPALSVGELSTQRGDGIFESIGVVDGHAQEVQAHLDRLAHSAEICDLPDAEPRPVASRRSVSRARALRAGRERHQAHPEPRRRARSGADGLGDGGARRGLLTRARDRGRPGRHARSRLRQRCAGARTVAAARREDPLVRREHGGDPRGEATRRGRRDLRVVGRHRARGADRLGHPSHRRHASSRRRRPAASCRGRPR